MPKRDDYLKMTSDDLRAARVLTLAVKFFGANGPIVSSDIHADLYPDLEDASFKRQFLRDRELLGTFGIQVREVEGTDPNTQWCVDEHASYVQGEGLSEHDARLLYVLCHDMAFDQAFAYRDELRMALAKISQMYRGTAIPHSDTTTPTQHKLLAVLVSCMASRHAASVTYTDAKGATSNRQLALLGTFGLRGNTYFVASRVQKDGQLVQDSVRTYRLDRFEKVKELQGISYQVPLDFSVSDYERLSFQIGDSLGTARFIVGPDAGREVQRAMATHGVIRTGQGSVIWEVPYSSLQAVAAWSIGSGVEPDQSQTDLCNMRARLLEQAASTKAYDASLVDISPSGTTTHARRAGRTGSVAVARQLVALASSLSREGEIITAHHISDTLGVSFDDARHLIALVSMGSGESIDYLPVIPSDDDDEVQLMEGAALNAPRVRLTRSETIALLAALGELGVSDDDPLVQTLTDSYAAPSFTVGDIERSFEVPSSASDGSTLRICSHAIIEGLELTFSYLPVTGGPTGVRRVVPQCVRRSDDSWYLDAFDLRRQADRVFRIDRMSDVTPGQAFTAPVGLPDNREVRMVTVRFIDPLYLDLFHWEGLQVIQRDEQGTTVRLPHFGGSWLARHLAACAGTVRVDDQALARQIADLVRQLQHKQLVF